MHNDGPESGLALSKNVCDNPRLGLGQTAYLAPRPLVKL